MTETQLGWWKDEWWQGRVLESDADEVLLAVLAQDTTPPPRHDMPYRRWAHPPSVFVRDMDGTWFERRPGWWELDPWEKARQARADRAAAERQARAAERAAARKPPPPPAVPLPRLPSGWGGRLSPDTIARLLRDARPH